LACNNLKDFEGSQWSYLWFRKHESQRDCRWN